LRRSAVFALLAVTLAINKQFGFGIVCIYKNRHILALVTVPCPVRKYMQRIRLFVPDAAIKIKAVFGNARKVNDAKHRTVIGPRIGIIRRRFAEIIEACPDELSDSPVIVVGEGKICIGKVRPRTVFKVV